MILIVGHRGDPHVAAVIRALEQCGSQFAILDSFSRTGDGIHHEISSGAFLEVGGSKKRLSEFTAVWWRQKPRFVVPTETPAVLYDYFFVHREWNHLIDFLGMETSHLFSINDREKNAIANNKITHLRAAAECGFEIPASLISNDVDSVIEFMAKADGKKCVYKPFTPYMPPSGKITYTSMVDIPLLLENRDTIRAAPGLFQIFVDKQFELRVTVVGSEVFAARINSHYSSKAQIDWRREIFADIYSEYELPDTLREKLIGLHRRLGLFYCAYDFVVNHGDIPILLDVNPAGQWMWLESRLGFPVSERIASALANPPSGVGH